MDIKVWDYLEEYAEERDDILAAVNRVFESGRLILGASVQAFENEFSSYCEVAHGIGVDNATNGLFLAMKALDIGQGDEVLTVSNTAVPTVSAIVQAGATPRFVDVDPGTYLMDVSQLEDAITVDTRCVIPVHLFGQCVDMEALRSICDPRGIHIVEDCSQSHGATQNRKKAGSMGDMGVFSFYPTKVLGGYGDGGMVVTDSSELETRLRSLRFYGMKGTYYAEEVGYNSRLDEVHAEILRGKLKNLDKYVQRRQYLARRYDEILNPTSLRLPTVMQNNEHVYYVYVVRHPDRERIMSKMKERGVSLNISYPWPIHIMRGFAYLGGKSGDLIHTEQAASEIFSLPMYPSLSEEAQDFTCQTLAEILGQEVNG